jgi:hypothetical protein
MGIALVDLSLRSQDGRSEGFISYAGNDYHNAPIFTASLAKLTVMFAAYHLRLNVQRAVMTLPLKKEEVWPALTAAWRPLVANQWPEFPPRLSEARSHLRPARRAGWVGRWLSQERNAGRSASQLAQAARECGG